MRTPLRHVFWKWWVAFGQPADFEMISIDYPLDDVNPRKSSKTLKNTFLYLVFVILSGAAFAQGSLPQGAEEGIFTIKYADFSLDVNTVVAEDSVYMPFVDFLSMMKIYFDVSDVSRISGYLFNRDSSFNLNTVDKTYMDIGGATHSLGLKGFIRYGSDVYVLPSIIEDMFKIEVMVRKKNLRILVRSSRYKFPLVLESEREQKYFAANFSKIKSEEDLPLLYDREWRWIDGGMLNYGVSSSQTKEYQSINGIASLGFQVLGGELTYSLSSNYSVQTKNMSKSENYRWRYSFTENDYISQFIYGSVSNSAQRGISVPGMINKSKNLRGVQVSNEPTRMPTNFNTIVIQDRIDPDWQVELYVNDRLYSQMRSDNLGYYRFDLPISYGNTNVDVKIYGPHGELFIKREMISVPSEFLSPGDVRYMLTGGEDITNGGYVGSAMVSLGMTSWFTNSVSFEKEYHARGYTLIDNSSFRLHNNLILNTSIEPEYFYKAGLRILTKDAGTFDIVYGLDEARAGGYGEKAQTVNLTAGLPRMFGIPFNMTIRANRVETSSLATTDATTGLNINWGQFNIASNYQVQFYENKKADWNMLRQIVNGQIGYSWMSKPKWLSWLGYTRFGVGSSYDFYTKEWGAVSLTTSQEIAKMININGSFQYMPREKTYSFHVGASWNTSAFRMNSNMDGAQNSVNSYNQDLAGTVKYDSNRGKMFFTNSGSYNSSSSGGASVRFFLDKNSNGYFDDGDTEINDGAVYVSGATIERDKTGPIRILNLLPGGRYNLYVKPNGFKNPIIAAKIMKFAFVADPNSMKQIDIPCYITGIIEGNVLKLDTNNTLSGQSGVKLHFVNKKDSLISYTVPVFSDGSYFKTGVVPGEYVAFVDTVQLAILNSVSNTGFVDLVVRETEDGDVISNFNFEIAGKSVRGGQYASAEKGARIPKEEEKQKAEDNPDATRYSVPDTALVPKSIPEAPTEEKIAEAPPKKVKANYPGNRTILFAGTKAANLSKDAIKYLDQLAEYLKNNPTARMKITGFTDNFGTKESNLQVSVKRAENVAKYLTKKGIDKTRLLYTGSGALYPVADNTSPDGREKNRRVEIELIK